VEVIEGPANVVGPGLCNAAHQNGI
jgi:hypothetical protein